MTAPWLEHRWTWMGGPSFRSGRGEGMGGEQGLGKGRRRRIWREEGGPGEQALGDGSGVGREEGGAWRGKADAISETRGKARFFGYAAGDGRSRKRVRDWTPIAGRLCGITCLFRSEAEHTLPQTRP